jgi:hypothetical protein
MLQKMLNDTPPVEAGGINWLWWLDIDTVVDPAQVCCLWFDVIAFSCPIRAVQSILSSMVESVRHNPWVVDRVCD